MTTKNKGFFGKGQDSAMGEEDQAFLSQIEQNIREKGNEQADAQKEAEHRASEMDRIRTASGNIPIPGVKSSAPAAGQSSPSAPGVSKKRNPLEDDPRYKEYFERLRRQKGEQAGGSSQTPAGGVQTQPTGGAVATGDDRRAATGGNQTVGPGAIVRFDDGSVGIYKDAVSGKDYALFYFLHPDGQFTPEGVFLQCYQARVIGTMPENYFSQMRDESQWSRDLIVFHLAKFEFVKDLDVLREHEERKPGRTPRGNPVIEKTTAPGHNTDHDPSSRTAGNLSAPGHQSAAPDTVSPRQESSVSNMQTSDSQEPVEAQQGEDLVKGRRFKINFGGKQWEAVYWTSDGDNAIVAHDTHGEWSLMRLDLARFKDSLELLDVVNSETMDKIAAQAAGA